ncbi:LamG domain-containing protein [Luteolibacter arcticus]|uniref:LamG domain-containing protein n=1 Tax=Luteolibacter arcticus TaxID=1581411 RepID=A0ABT3GGN7_9BACT|nr:LamG domain-containing protein [Luteolibacter arcticus]MCW1922780.1 LamG domain-containing protein [Luteolibacter arcticus]
MNRKLLSFASGVCGLATSSHADLIAHYKFDEPAAATTALNEVAGNATGAVQAGVTTGLTGIAGNAYQFNDSTGHVDMGNANFLPSINATGKLTLSAWIKTTVTTGGRNVVVFAGVDTSTQNYTDLGYSGADMVHAGEAYTRNRPNLGTGAQSAGFFSDGTVVNNGEWQHLAMTVELSTNLISLYVNGVLENTQTMTTSTFPAFNNFEIGRLGRSVPTDYFGGLIDDVQVYNQVLTPVQITFLKDHPGEAFDPADTDNDGLEDTWEILHFDVITAQSGTDIGPDNDGATNLEEQAAGTNPKVADTDGDGRTDGAELHTAPLTLPLDPDSDDDGLNDGAEVNVPGTDTDPNNADSDFDSLPDGWEVANLLDPKSGDEDDGATGDPDNDDLDNSGEYHAGLNSTNPNDGDTDDDGYTDLQEDRTGTWSGIIEPNPLPFTGTNPLIPDTDGDGFLDGQENPDVDYVPGVTSGTNPNLYDSDTDGFNDQAEFVFGSDPTDTAVIPIVAKGLVAHYKFNEAAAATTAVSALANNPGTVGSGVITGETGIAGNAYRFSNGIGQADIVDMGNAPFLTDILAAKALTYSAWIKSTDVSSGRNAFISAANTTLDNSYVDFGVAGQVGNVGALSGRLRPNGNVNIAEIFSNTAPHTTLVNDDVWHHVALTVDLATTSIKLYVDGVPTGENTAIPVAVFPVFNNFEIGRLGRKVPTDGFAGLVDDVQIYNEALSPARIAALHAMPGVSADEDHDRLDDQWEIDNFGSISAQNGSGDPDGDTIDNEAEETAGTSPAALATITAVNFVPGGDYTIHFTGNANTTFRVTKSTNLEGFTEMAPPVTAATDGSGVGTAIVPAAQAAGTAGFYRLETP